MPSGVTIPALICSALGTMPQDAPSAAPEPSGAGACQPGACSAAEAVPEPDFVLDLPVYVGDAYARDLAVGIVPDGTVVLRADQLAALLSDFTDEAFLAALDLPEGEALIAEAAVRERGLDLAYDPARLSVTVRLPAASRVGGAIRVAERDAGRPPDALEQAGTSAAISVELRPSFQTGTSGDEAGLTGRVGGFLNVGGFDGAQLVLDGAFDVDARVPARLGEATLFKDDYERAVRYAAGTLRPGRIGRFSSTPDLLGVGVFRAYEAINPFANLRPDAATTFLLEEPSLVTIEVNGQPVLTERFQPGRYDLSDLPLSAGGNDVRILAEEAGGQRELAVLSAYVASDLLRAGRSRFALAAGRYVDRSGAVVSPTGVTGYAATYERGLTNQLTLGGGIEGADERWQASARVVAGTKLGIFVAEGAYQDDSAPTAAGALRWAYAGDGPGGVPLTMDVQFLVQEEGFSPIRATPPRRGPDGLVLAPGVTDLSARAGTVVGPVALRGSVSRAERGGTSTTAGTLGVSANVGAVALGLDVRLRQAEGPLGDTERSSAVLFTLSRRFGRTVRGRATYDTGDQRAQLRATRFRGRALGAWGGDVLVQDDDAGEALDARVNASWNRADAGLNVRAARLRDQETVRAEAQLAFGIGVAGGHVALGRPVRDGFAIVRRHDSVSDKPLSVEQGGVVTARAGTLGPAMVLLNNAYRASRSRVGIADLGVGYNVGRTDLSFHPGAKAGFVHTVGSEPATTLMASLMDADGAPLALTVGRLVPVGAASAEEGSEGAASFFTNRTGRLVVEGLVPGTYEVRLDPDGRLVGTLDVPDQGGGLVRLGEVTIDGNEEARR